MNDQPCVSVIVIFLNEALFIEAAIASVFAQTYQDWELLLVDDGSKDQSTGIAQQYAHQYPNKVRYLEHQGHQNCGMSASRNLGIANARGKYITFLDADDIWTTQKLKRQVAILEAQPEAALVCNPAEWWYSWTGKPEDIERDFIQRFEFQLDTLIQPPTVLIQFLQDEWASLCDILVRREIVDSVSGYETAFRGMYEDQAFHAKLCLQFPVYVSSQCGYKYRQHSQACTATSHTTGQTDAARFVFLNWLEKYITNHAAPSTSVQRVLRTKLFPYRYPILSRALKKMRRTSNRIKRLIKLVVQRIELPITSKP